MARPLVLYHNYCLDGLSGAWAAWKKFGSRADYLGLEHQEPVPKELKGRELIFIDICYPAEIMKKVVKQSPHVLVIDHHVSQKEALAYAHDVVYALHHSGCVLAWKTLHPGTPVPYFLRVIEDNDLHRLVMPGTNEYVAVLSGIPFSFQRWSKLAKDFASPSKRRTYLQKGHALLEYKRQLIDRALKNSEPVMFEGHSAMAINTPTFYSDSANTLYERHDVHLGIAWFYKKGKIHVSLRSDGTIDVAKLALKYNGGGHKAAAGFSYPIKGAFPWKMRPSK